MIMMIIVSNKQNYQKCLGNFVTDIHDGENIQQASTDCTTSGDDWSADSIGQPQLSHQYCFSESIMSNVSVGINA